MLKNIALAILRESTKMLQLQPQNLYQSTTKENKNQVIPTKLRSTGLIALGKTVIQSLKKLK